MKILREENAVFENIIDNLMTDTSTASQDLIENKLKFVENQFISEHDDAKHSAENHFAKNLTEDIAEDLIKNIAKDFIENFAENFIEHTAKNFIENIAKNLTENIAKNLKQNHLDDDNIFL